MISLSVAIRERPAPVSLPLVLRVYDAVILPPNGRKITLCSTYAPWVWAPHEWRLSAWFPNGSTAGRGKAEYGGLSLQSARLGYSTVISLRLLRKSPTLQRISVPKEAAAAAATEHKSPRVQLLTGRVADSTIAERREGGEEWRRDRGAAVLSSASLLAPNSSCIFMTHKAVQSSAERADVGLWVGVSRQTNATQVFIPATCGINVYEWREPWALISAGMRG